MRQAVKLTNIMKDKDTKKVIVAVGLLLLFCMLICLFLFWHRPRRSPATTVVFSSFGPSNSFSSYGYDVGCADWFVPTVSGTLSSIEIAVEPDYPRGIDPTDAAMEPIAGALELFLAKDESGFPGPILEQFSLAAEAASSPPRALPLVFNSVAQPKLEAGVKYWLGARSSGPVMWSWHIGDHQFGQKAARENEQGKWISMGDGCYLGAFSIIVNTNQETHWP
jgi:hypothetical protein